jgi:hypothetical protein
MQNMRINDQSLLNINAFLNSSQEVLSLVSFDRFDDQCFLRRIEESFDVK